jgi:hypothetical protein
MDPTRAGVPGSSARFFSPATLTAPAVAQTAENPDDLDKYRPDTVKQAMALHVVPPERF